MDFLCRPCGVFHLTAPQYLYKFHILDGIQKSLELGGIFDIDNELFHIRCDVGNKFFSFINRGLVTEAAACAGVVRPIKVFRITSSV